jgi:SPP1 gp7 family putative phage head morphogenesis protein
LLDALILEIYNLQGTDGSISTPIANYYADKLWAATEKGFGTTLASVDYESPDYNMLQALKKNVFQFSVAKNYQQLRELSDALLDENGNLREFEAFRDAAKLINDRYVKTWLRTEYDFAVGAGQMAGKWNDILKNSQTLPLLQYESVIDSHTTDICRPLHGTILPIDHPFWKVYYPLNHFGCRSTVRQLASGVVTAEDKIPNAEIPAMFRSNLAERGLLFPPDHAYFIGLPEAILNQTQQ